jgi:hypothetical protein
VWIRLCRHLEGRRCESSQVAREGSGEGSHSISLLAETTCLGALFKQSVIHLHLEMQKKKKTRFDSNLGHMYKQKKFHTVFGSMRILCGLVYSLMTLHHPF